MRLGKLACGLLDPARTERIRGGYHHNPKREETNN
jgi:hypothetical protein